MRRFSARAPRWGCYRCRMHFFDGWTLAGHLIAIHNEWKTFLEDDNESR